MFYEDGCLMATRDYETLKGMIIGGGRYNFEHGTSVSNSQEFVDKIESEYQSSIANQENWGWRTVYAFFFIPSDQMTPQQTIKTVNGSTPSLKLLTQLILSGTILWTVSLIHGIKPKETLHFQNNQLVYNKKNRPNGRF